MSTTGTSTTSASNRTAPTQFLEVNDEKYAYRRFGQGPVDPPSGPEVAANQMAAFREWERFTGESFADLKSIQQPTLVVNGVHDEMIPVSNSYLLAENLPNAVLLVYPDSGHGSLFQFHESFTRNVTAFLASDFVSAAY